ncbi:MAG TPA: RNA-binding protein, partial [Thermoanaerobaculia bacterium]|jgi:RNA recognition motif-containing protein
MGKKLFVGNLSFDTTSEQLSELFAKVGTIQSAMVMTDRATGRSRGFGFVEMGTDEEAQKAVTEYNGKEFQGRNLNVDVARERTPGAPRDFSPRGPRPSMPSPGFDFDPRDGGGFGGPPPKPRKEGGSRRNLRARKRSL